MRKLVVMLVVPVIGILVAVGLTKRSRYQVSQSGSGAVALAVVLSPTPALGGQATYQGQVRRFGAVEVEAVPQRLQVGEKVVFELSFDTHSVELDHDYTAIADLWDDQGNSHQALTWSGGRSGHHVAG